ncbi:MAG: hypothetical protein FWG65_07895 [Turicibacter sp.]|nr:hypothetical protein [Turicibacter sp.]
MKKRICALALVALLLVSVATVNAVTVVEEMGHISVEFREGYFTITPPVVDVQFFDYVNSATAEPLETMLFTLIHTFTLEDPAFIDIPNAVYHVETLPNGDVFSGMLFAERMSAIRDDADTLVAWEVVFSGTLALLELEVDF